MRDVLVSGMFRSGTTLVSRLISASPRALVVADPFVYFFKAYRNFHLRTSGATGWRPDEPTSDHFRSPTAAVDRAIGAANLSEPMPAEDLGDLRKQIHEWKAHQHPDLCRRLDELEGGTFADVYRQLIELCVELYGTGTVELAGTKVSWSEEFLPALARAFPSMRFVLLVRDVRAIVASQDSRQGIGRGKRPLLFYVRHWRKSVAFTRRLAADPELCERVHVLRYEDLVAEPARRVAELARFLDLPFDAAMLDPRALPALDGTGAWQPNSSFADPSIARSGLYTESVTRWKEALTRAQIDALDALAGPELAWMGYATPDAVRDPLDCLGTACEPPVEELAPWMRELPCVAYLRDPAEREREYGLESVRRRVLEGNSYGDDDEGLFLGVDVRDALGSAWRRRRAAG